MQDIDLHTYRMRQGQHQGVRITRVPVSYLKWMVKIRHAEAGAAELELKRRGTITPTVDISGHAMDSASLRLRKRWYNSRKAGEGLYSWLVRMCEAALEFGDEDPLDKGSVYYCGMKFVFTFDEVWPTLKTIMAAKRRRK